MRIEPCLLLTVVALARADAQTPVGANTASPPQVEAVHRPSPITLDGRLDDGAWQRALPATPFRQRDPNEGAPATQATEVRFLYDDDALYVGARMYEGTAGADFDRWWAKHTYRLTASGALSSVDGDSLALQHIQTSSVHYFQRPGRTAIGGTFDSRFDAARRRLNGYAGVVRFAKDGGDLTWEGLAETVSPGFEANDLGFISIAGVNWLGASIRRAFNVPRAWYHAAGVTAGAENAWNFDGDATARAYHLAADVTTPSYWTLSAVARHLPAHYDDRLLRGGPTVAAALGDSVEVDVASDARRALTAGVRVWWAAGRIGNRDVGAAPTLTVHPTDALSLSVGVHAQRLEVRSQFVAAIADRASLDSVVRGTRFVVAATDQRTVWLELRASAALSPTLSFDAYAQPFATAGAYREFGELSARTVSRFVYGRDVGTARRTVGADGVALLVIDPDGDGPLTAFTLRNPSRTTRSLRGTCVIRWEYRPGSSLIAAWTQTRLDVDAGGALNFDRDTRALTAARPTNALVVKATYRFAR
jgi:hypothetical protein